MGIQWFLIPRNPVPISVFLYVAVLGEATELGLLNYIEFRQRGLDQSPGIRDSTWQVLLEGPLGATLLPLRSVSQPSAASLCQLSINHLLLRLILQLCKHTLFICYGPLNWMSAPGFPLFHV